MTAHTTLAELIARKLAPEMTGFDYDMLLEGQQAEIIVRVQPVLDACQAEAMLSALRTLVAAKDEKEWCGNTERYQELKERGWSEARAIVARLDKPMEQPT